ncbi:hypothetical protein [Paracraurococcus lichenis]|uniref:Lipoprotein n=1 Tax=Paracraurococcus lichenis TaxID=3064888 RepID=A0ABT9DVZ4_9PROT|nr:hypothetical protein [Paracraurococcus sp. LOR1-02]MDO9708058.1 hypothetical protein [Paracraurococcus sp. LOR1-02]
MTRLLLVLLALGTLAACGRAGPPRVPGPKEAVIYPRGYPHYEPQPAPQAQPPAR